MIQGSEDVDELLSQALQTRAGARTWPKLAERTSRRQEDAVLIDALHKTIAQLGGEGKNSQLRGPIVGRLLSNCSSRLSAAYLRAQLGITDSARRFAKYKQKHVQTPGGSVLDSSYDSGNLQGRLRLHNLVQDIIEDVFREHTYIDSAGGAKRSLTRKLTMEKWRLHTIFYAQYPAMLRERARFCPQPRPNGVLTKLQKDMRTALWAAAQPGFDEAAEFKARKKQAEGQYIAHVANVRLARAGVHIEPKKRGPKQLTQLYDPAKHTITVPSEATFFQVLFKRKIKYTQVENATRCPIHDEGPNQIKQLEIVNHNLCLLNLEVCGRLTVTQAAKKQNLLKVKRKLDKQVRLYKMHCLQYETQRKKVQDIEAALKPGEGVLYRDYVNDHDEAGNKVCNLVLVLRHRLKQGEELVTTNIHNFGDKESCDAYWTADIFDFHFAPGDAHHSGLFDDITKITIVGDHGPHFSANETIFNESTFFVKYSKQVNSIFLCSYHAYNRCDGAGVVPKRLSKQAQRSGAGPLGAEAYSHAVNMSNYDNHVAFYFPTVNRSEYVFSSQLEKHTNLRPMCDFQYHYTNAQGEIVREPGIVLVKFVSDDELPYQVIDLVRRPIEQQMCSNCSSRQQRPVRHVLEKSTCLPPLVFSLDRCSLATPDSNRVRGPQVQPTKKHTKRQQRVKKKTSEIGKFSCLSPFCDRHFKTAGGANRHMEREHKQEQLQFYASVKAVSKSKPTCQSLKRKRTPDSPVVTTLSSSKGDSVCPCLSVCVSDSLSVSISLMLKCTYM